MKVCTYVNRQVTYRKIWGVGWGQSTISSMFLNRDPEFTGERNLHASERSEVPVKFF